MTSTRLRLQSFGIHLDDKPRVRTQIRRNLVDVAFGVAVAITIGAVVVSSVVAYFAVSVVFAALGWSVNCETIDWLEGQKT